MTKKRGATPWKKLRRPVFWTLGSALLTLLLLWWAGGHPESAASWISFSRGYGYLISGLLSFLPFALAEYALYVSLVWLLFTLGRAVFRLFRRKTAFYLTRWATRLALTVSCLIFAFFTLWGMAYYTPSLNELLSVPKAEHSPDALYQTAVWLRDEMNRWATQVPRTAEGVMSAGGFTKLAPLSGAGFTELNKIWPLFPADPLPAKSATFPSLMSSSAIAGIYVPFTGEPIVNGDTVDAHLPFTLCHEMGHRCGFGREDEVNFIAFLACVNNPAPAFAYSGYHLAYIFTYNALNKQDPDRAAEVNAGVLPVVRADFKAQTEYIARYKKSPMWEVGEAVNDTYLKTMGQEEGALSYGEVVDLLIDWRAQKEEDA